MSVKSKIASLSLLFAFIILHTNAFGLDKAKVASLNYRLENESTDSLRVYLLDSLAYEYSQNDLSMALKYADQAFDLAEKSCTSKEIAAALFTLATINYHRGLIEISIRQYSRCLDIAQELKDTKRIASAMVNLGAVYLSMDNLVQSRKNFEQALKSYL